MTKKLISVLLALMLILTTASVVSAEGTPEKVVMGFFAFNGAPAEKQMVEDAINAITRDSIGVEVELLILDGASYAQQTMLMLSGNEQLDIYTSIIIGFSSVINNGYALDLEQNDLIQTYGQGIIDEMGSYLDACRFDGKLYGLPQNLDYAGGRGGYFVVAEYLDGIGYEYEANEINHVTYDELDDVFARLHEAYPEKEVYVPQQVLVNSEMVVDALGSDYFGVLMNPMESLKVSNLFESQEYLDAVKRVYNWNQLGYISGDALTDETATNLKVSAGTAMSYLGNYKPGVILQESMNCNRQMVLLQANDTVFIGSNMAQMPWCINSNTKHPEAAMKLMNAFYTDPALSNLLCYGIEGQHYVVNSDGLFTFPEGVDGATDGYHPNITWLMPNQFIAGVWEGNSPTVWEDTAAMNDNASKSLAIGFTFDNSKVAVEYTALSNVYEQYRDQIEFGFVEPEVGIAEMNSKLKSAGLEKYIAEKQAQIDAWEATKAN